MKVCREVLSIFVVAPRNRGNRSSQRYEHDLARGTLSKILFTIIIWGMLLLVVSDRAQAVQIHDDFSSGVGTWIAGPGWSLYNPSLGNFYYRADYNGAGDTLTWQNKWTLDSSWRFEADLSFQSVYRDGGTAGTGSLALSANNLNPSISLLADVVYSPPGALLIEVAYLTSDGGSQ